MSPLHFRPWPALLALAALWACDPPSRSVPEGERDAAVDATAGAPDCPYAPEPLALCEGARAPEPACIVDIEGGGGLAATRQAFDERGRYVGTTWGDYALRYALDEQGREVLAEEAVDGCVVSRYETHRTGHEQWSHRVDETAEWCAVGTLVTDPLLQSHGVDFTALVGDEGCDCRDVQTLVECESGPSGPVECARFYWSGTANGSYRIMYDDAGRAALLAWDADLDGEPDQTRTWRFDAEDRLVEEWFECADCDPHTTRWHFDFETAPRRETVRRDEGDDGFAESVTRRTFDEQGREVLGEWGDDDGLTYRVETTYDAAGGFREVETDAGRVVRTRERVIGDGGRSETEITTEEGGERLSARRFDDNGALVETVHRWTDPTGALNYLWHHTYRRDERGRLVSQRSRLETGSGYVDVCTIAYTWSGPCPVAPVDYDGDGCLAFEPE